MGPLLFLLLFLLLLISARAMNRETVKFDLGSYSYLILFLPTT